MPLNSEEQALLNEDVLDRQLLSVSNSNAGLDLSDAAATSQKMLSKLDILDHRIMSLTESKSEKARRRTKFAHLDHIRNAAITAAYVRKPLEKNPQFTGFAEDPAKLTEQDLEMAEVSDRLMENQILYHHINQVWGLCAQRVVC